MPSKQPKQISPDEAFRILGSALFLDIRSPKERQIAYIEGSHLLPPPKVKEEIASFASDKSENIVLYCASGKRSLAAAKELSKLGYQNLYNLDGGIEAWQKEALPVSSGIINANRYSRQMLLPEIGVAGQEKLLGSSVLLVGAGGLGSPSALYLAAAGVGRMGIVDGDTVEESNLQRQIIHGTDRLGQNKALSAKETLSNLNPGVRVEVFPERIHRDNAEEITGGWDLVIDGSDNFQTRYLLADITRRNGQPLVSAAILGFEGQLATFFPGGACYRCLFPEPPPPELAPSCQTNGILGSVAGILGILQANEALKVLLGIGENLQGRLLLIDALGTRFRELPIYKDPECPLCSEDAPREIPDYVEICS